MRPEPRPSTDNQVQFSPFAEGATLMQAAFTDYAFERHSHDCYAIGVTTHGTQQFRCKGREYVSRPGELVMFNPDEDHDGDRGSSAGFAYSIWYLPVALVQECMDADAGVAGSLYFSTHHLSDLHMADRFGRLSKLLQRGDGEPLRDEVLMQTFIGTLLSRYGEGRSS
jgi:hypothetical protein